MEGIINNAFVAVFIFHSLFIELTTLSDGWQDAAVWSVWSTCDDLGFMNQI